MLNGAGHTSVEADEGETSDQQVDIGGMVVAARPTTGEGARILEILRRRTAEHLKLVASPRGRCVLVTLVHIVPSVTGDSNNAHIVQEPVDEKLSGASLDVELVAIAQSVVKESMSHASAATGSQAYAVIFYARDDVVLQQHRFNAGPSSRSLVLGNTEGPNEIGITGQMMRHTEISMRMMVASWQDTQDRLKEANADLKEEARELRVELRACRAKEAEQHGLLEALRDGKAKRDQEIEEARMMAQTGQEIVTFVKDKILPAVIAKYSPVHPSEEFMAGVEPSQLLAMLDVFKPHQLEQLKGFVPDEKWAEVNAYAARTAAATATPAASAAVESPPRTVETPRQTVEIPTPTVVKPKRGKPS